MARYIVRPRGTDGKPMRGGHPSNIKPLQFEALDVVSAASRCRPDHGMARAVISVWEQLPSLAVERPRPASSSFRSERVVRQGKGNKLRVLVVR